MAAIQQEAVLKQERNRQLIESYPKIKNSLSLSYRSNILNLQDVPVLYFSASRSKVSKPKKAIYSSIKNPNFLDYMLSLSDNNYNHPETAISNSDLYSQCFSDLQGFLQELYEVPELKLKADIEKYNFFICIPDREPFAIHQVSNSFASLINIFTGLVMRSVLLNSIINYEFPAIALIDELEAHLHVSLQRKIFPLFARMFPNVQFIVTTYSPFIISALENVVVFDIEKQRTLKNAVFYSYTTIVESYFCTSQQYRDLEKYLACFKMLSFKDKTTPQENAAYIEALLALDKMTPANYELFSKYQEILSQRAAISYGQVNQGSTSK
jgi:AAA15 family ATPase/GTPase